MKAKERKELEEELKLKEAELEECEIRMKGGFSKTLKRDVVSVETEVNRLLRIIEMKTLEMNYDKPVQPKYEFENNERWREIARTFLKEDLEKYKEALSKVTEQHKKMMEQMPELKKRIKEIKSRLGIEEGATYIG